MLSILQGDAHGVHVPTAVHVVLDLVAGPLGSKAGESVVVVGIAVGALARRMNVAMGVTFTAFCGIGDSLADVAHGRLDLVPNEGHIECWWLRSLSRMCLLTRSARRTVKVVPKERLRECEYLTSDLTCQSGV